MLEHQWTPENVGLRLAKLDMLTACPSEEGGRTGQAGTHVRPRCAGAVGGPPPGLAAPPGRTRADRGRRRWLEQLPAEARGGLLVQGEHGGGMSSVAVTDGVAPPPRSDVMPAPAPTARDGDEED